MADSETVKVELELPRSQVHIEPVDAPEVLASGAESEPAKLEKTRQIMNERSPKRRLQKLRQELMLSRKAQDDKAVKSNPSPLEALPISRDTRPPNRHQRSLIAVGLIIAVVGLMLWPLTSFVAAILIALIGASLVATGTFVRV